MSAVDYSPRRIMGLAIPMSGEQFLVFGVALFDTALGHWLIRLPLIVLLAGAFHLGLTSVWLAMVSEMAVRSVLNVLRFKSGFWLQVQPEVSRA